MKSDNVLFDRKTQVLSNTLASVLTVQPDDDVIARETGELSKSKATCTTRPRRLIQRPSAPSEDQDRHHLKE